MTAAEGARKPMRDAEYLRHLTRLQRELVKMQEWVVHEGLRVCVLFEGRDAAGKGGTIKRIVDRTNPRAARSCCSTGAGTTGPAWNA